MRVTVCELPSAAPADDWPRLVEHVRTAGSDLVLLPELGLSPWFARERRADAAAWARAVADHEAWIAGRLHELGDVVVLGTAPVDREGRRLNEAFVHQDGVVRPAHHKRHLPDEPGFWEASWYGAGDGGFDLVDAGPARAGFLICTELWFTEHARAYGRAGAHLLAVPRCTPRESLDKWLAGGRTAAVVAGAYALSSNHADAPYGGMGWVVDPEGEVLAVTSREQPFATVTIDLAFAEASKRTYPRYVPG